jgi:hypothetical protein
MGTLSFSWGQQVKGKCHHFLRISDESSAQDRDGGFVRHHVGWRSIGADGIAAGAAAADRSTALASSSAGADAG